MVEHLSSKLSFVMHSGYTLLATIVIIHVRATIRLGSIVE